MTEQPLISGMCLTYGKPHLLEEAIACFTAQECEWPLELVVFNTCPQQKLSLPDGYDPRVRIINCDKRPGSLGASRNLAIAMSNGGIIVTHDDDDLYLPNHYQNFVNAFKAQEIHWAWQTAQFYSEKSQIKSITAGGQNVVAFKKQAWQDVGCYNALNCGEDRDFVGRLTSKFNGVKIEMPPEKISFIYRWDTDTFHVSGLGDDARQKFNAWKRAEAYFKQQVHTGRMKLGRIKLNPQLKRDYAAQRTNYLATLNAHG